MSALGQKQTSQSVELSHMQCSKFHAIRSLGRRYCIGKAAIHSVKSYRFNNKDWFRVRGQHHQKNLHAFLGHCIGWFSLPAKRPRPSTRTRESRALLGGRTRRSAEAVTNR